VRFPAGAIGLSLLKSVQTGSGTHSASYPMGTGAVSPGLRWSEHEADHSSSAEVENVGAIPPLPHTCLII
jgi:hypothetical protein